MTAIHLIKTDHKARQLWRERASARQALFGARDAMTAQFLQRVGSGNGSLVFASDSVGAPPFTFSLDKPVAPRSWWKRRASLKLARKRRRELLESGLFEGAWYCNRYPDVALSGQDALTHFLCHGSFEGRSPGPNFDAMGYLARYPDVVEERIEPWLHFVRHGKIEGRSPI